jgi:hypothetical protein
VAGGVPLNFLRNKHHMEDVMDAALWWKRQLVGNSADVGQNLKWSVELWRELAPRLISECSGQAVMKAQPYPITFFKRQLTVC